MGMKVCIVGGPSTGKSFFARAIADSLNTGSQPFPLLQEYPTAYLRQVGQPKYLWEQLVLTCGQAVAEERLAAPHFITEGAAFVSYLYARRLLALQTPDADLPRYQHLLEVLRAVALDSAQRYDLIFLLTHCFPRAATAHDDSYPVLAQRCEEIGGDIAEYLTEYRIPFHRLRANDTRAVAKAVQLIQQRLVISSAV